MWRVVGVKAKKKTNKKTKTKKNVCFLIGMCCKSRANVALKVIDKPALF